MHLLSKIETDHVTLTASPSWMIYHSLGLPAIVLVSINLNTEYETPCFTLSKDMNVAQKF